MFRLWNKVTICESEKSIERKPGQDCPRAMMAKEHLHLPIKIGTWIDGQSFSSLMSPGSAEPVILAELSYGKNYGHANWPPMSEKSTVTATMVSGQVSCWMAHTT
ncbi:hypothetical protein TNCV_834631 [Trichonephila clavipes]|nr:hypothetical protein TNCV_834631 [Trichonephila clavipes]